MSFMVYSQLYLYMYLYMYCTYYVLYLYLYNTCNDRVIIIIPQGLWCL